MSEIRDEQTSDSQPNCTSACENCMFHGVYRTLDGTFATKRSEKLALKESLTNKRFAEEVGGNVVKDAMNLLESCRHRDKLTGVIEPILRDVQNLLEYSDKNDE